jgi:hypothetical protein
MNMGEIVKDAVKYPFSSIKNYLILTIIISIGLYVGFTSVFVNGYSIRMLKSSVEGDSKSPEFNHWLTIFVDGLKVYVVGIGYSIPVIVFFLIYIVVGSLLASFFSTSESFTGIFAGFTIIASIIIILYIVSISPIFLMALVHMAKNNEFDAAFRLREILNKISSIGWKKLIKWYLLTIIPVVFILIGASILIIYISAIFLLPLLKLFLALILVPFNMYVYRSAALFYMSKDQGYLICEECGGYYQLQPGESTEDFDTCQCGGKLTYTESIPSNDNEDLNSVEAKNGNFNKKNLILIIGLLALILIPLNLYIHSTQTPINYTLLGSYNASNLGDIGTAITIPNGTKNIKIDYNLSWAPVNGGANGLILDAYQVNIGGTVPPGASNIIVNKVFSLKEWQNKSGTYYLNDPRIKSLAISSNGINGTLNVYISK